MKVKSKMEDPLYVKLMCISFVFKLQQSAHYFLLCIYTMCSFTENYYSGSYITLKLGSVLHYYIIKMIRDYIIFFHVTLGKKLEIAYPSIRYKMASALNNWHPSDKSAHKILEPWMEVPTNACQ